MGSMSEIVALGEVTLKVRPEEGESQKSQWKNIPGRGSRGSRSPACSGNRPETRVAESELGRDRGRITLQIWRLFFFFVQQLE